ncbi:MAG: BTAD domain-containing putative transcriptional regulator, partial [Pseudomonadota bacterium]
MSQQRQVLIRLFGSFEFLVDDAPQPLAIAGATKSLLQYLVCFPERQVRRDLLVEMFWGEIRFDRRRSALNSAIWRIRKALRLIRGVELDACTESVALHLSSNVERDVDQLASLLQILQTQGLGETDRSSALGRLKDSLARCGAPVLDGIDDDWAVIERDRFSELYVKGLTVMMRATAERRCYDDALDYGRQILCIDPFREAVFCEVMCLCMMSGQR